MGRVSAASSNGYSYLGYNSGSTGTATVTGAGSTWTNYYLEVGYSGSGIMNVEAGGQISNYGYSYCDLGSNSGSTGTVTITGTGNLDQLRAHRRQ